MVRQEHIVAALEQLYGDREAPLQRWAEACLPKLGPLLAQGAKSAFCSYSSAEREFRFLAFEDRSFDGQSLALLNASRVVLADADGFRRCYRPAHPITFLSDVDPALGWLHRRIFGAGDALGLISEPEPGVGLAAVVFVPERAELSRAARRVLTLLVLHLEASVRLRLRPDAVRGYVTPQGRVEVSAGALSSAGATALAHSAQGVDRARTKRHRADGEEALAVWHALVAGQYSLAERVDTDGKRVYELYENAPKHAPLRALTERESFVVHECARGLSNKEIAYALGLSSPSVSVALAGAAQKLGLADTRVLVRLASGLRGAGAGVEALGALGTLTGAERAVATLAACGLSNAQIARARACSDRTVANQLAAVLRKTGARSRRELAVRVPSL